MAHTTLDDTIPRHKILPKTILAGDRYISMYLRANTDSHNAIPVLPDFNLVHLIFRFCPGLDVLLRPIDMASSICDL